MRALIAIVCVATLAQRAAADCDDQADCILREEATKLFVAGKYAEAAEKFKASAAARPTARAYLGYAQSLAQIGKVALAYDAIREAKQLSEKEVAEHGDDVDVTSRAGRIDYVTGEIRAKVGLVRLSLPGGVPAKTLVSVQRKGEGDLEEPLDNPVAVAPDRQKLIALLRDGRSVPFEVAIGAGLDGSAVIPVGDGGDEPEPPEPPSHEPRLQVLGLAGLIPSSDRNGGNAWGGIVGVEYRAQRWLALRGGVAYFQHETVITNQVDFDPPHNFGGNEIIVQIGARTAIRPFFVGLDIGLLHFAQQCATATDLAGPEEVASTYLALMPNVGVHYKRFEARVGVVYVVGLDVTHLMNAPNADLDDLRAMITIGIALP